MADAKKARRPGQVSGRAFSLITRRPRVQITPPLPNRVEKPKQSSRKFDFVATLIALGLTESEALDTDAHVDELVRRITDRRISLEEALRAVRS